MLASPLLWSKPLTVRDVHLVFLLGSEALTPLPELTVTSTFMPELIYLLRVTHHCLFSCAFQVTASGTKM